MRYPAGSKKGTLLGHLSKGWGMCGGEPAPGWGLRRMTVSVSEVAELGIPPKGGFFGGARQGPPILDLEGTRNHDTDVKG